MRRALTLLCLLFVSTAFADGTAGVTWTSPKAWISDQQRPMRAATYHVSPAKGDAEGAECAVFYFGQGQGGSVDANVTRWIGQFEQPDGKPSSSAAKTTHEKVKDLPVTRVEVAGTYTGAGGPMSQVPVKKPGFKLLGAIVEGPQGPVFFKLTGLVKTVDGARADFDKMLQSIAH
jgi:hypothetical protein